MKADNVRPSEVDEEAESPLGVSWTQKVHTVLVQQKATQPCPCREDQRRSRPFANRYSIPAEWYHHLDPLGESVGYSRWKKDHCRPAADSVITS